MARLKGGKVLLDLGVISIVDTTITKTLSSEIVESILSKGLTIQFIENNTKTKFVIDEIISSISIEEKLVIYQTQHLFNVDGDEYTFILELSYSDNVLNIYIQEQ